MILTAAAVMALVAQCVPGLPSDLVPLAARVAMHESGGNTLVPNHHNTNGTIDGGLMQINSDNWPRFGLTQETVLDECANIRAGVAILQEGLSRYNAGRVTPRGLTYAAAVMQDKKVVRVQPKQSPTVETDENWRMFDDKDSGDQVFSQPGELK